MVNVRENAEIGNQFEELARQLITYMNGWTIGGAQQYVITDKEILLDFDRFRSAGRLSVVRAGLERFSSESNRIILRPFETVTKDIVAQFTWFAAKCSFDPESDVQILALQLRQDFGD